MRRTHLARAYTRRASACDRSMLRHEGLTTVSKDVDAIVPVPVAEKRGYSSLRRRGPHPWHCWGAPGIDMAAVEAWSPAQTRTRWWEGSKLRGPEWQVLSHTQARHRGPARHEAPIFQSNQWINLSAQWHCGAVGRSTHTTARDH